MRFLLHLSGFSITRLRFHVEVDLRTGALFNLRQEDELRPAKPLNRVNIPCPLFRSEIRLHDNHVLRPANAHRSVQGGCIISINSEELAHPAHVPRREPTNIRIPHLQILRSGDRRALFREVADKLTNLPVQLHLRQVFCHDHIQRFEQDGIVDFLSDVHRFSFLMLSVYNLICICSKAEKGTVNRPYGTVA